MVDSGACLCLDSCSVRRLPARRVGPLSFDSSDARLPFGCKFYIRGFCSAGDESYMAVGLGWEREAVGEWVVRWERGWERWESH